MSLTGRFCFRRCLFGKVVLMVEEERREWPFSNNGATRTRWRDAALMDLTHHELRKILELRDRTATTVQEPAAVVDAAARKRSAPSLPESVGWQYPALDGNPIRLNGH
jgi:hypothetical protein